MERGDSRRQQAKKNGTLGSSDDDNSEPADIERLLGIAMGCIGMSMDDFCRCVPSEFYEAYEAWSEMRESTERGRWERMRMQCLCSLQPYSKDRLRAQDIMQFPWEQENTSGDGAADKHAEVSHEEMMARYREAKQRMGLD